MFYLIFNINFKKESQLEMLHLLNTHPVEFFFQLKFEFVRSQKENLKFFNSIKPPLEIRSLYIQVYSVRYVNIL